jgi:hypothetical protein
MKKNTFIPFAFTLILVFAISCQNSTQKKTDLSTQDKYEKFLTDMGVTIPSNATFKEIKKTNDGNYKIFYNLSPAENLQDSLQTFYENQLDNILLSKGWRKPENGWNPHGTKYEKDNHYFKFFLVVSKEHDIYELAFKYGE